MLILGGWVITYLLTYLLLHVGTVRREADAANND